PEVIPSARSSRDIAEGIRPMAEEKESRSTVGPVFGAVETDPGLSRSVLQNSSSNAVRYTEQGGILVGVRRRGTTSRIDVVETGVGIPEDQQKAVVSEFTRSGAVEAEGLGLGLAIVERIARSLGVRSELASTPGKGSRFSVISPAVAMPDEDADAHTPFSAGRP
ncbi:hypothetical protein OY671_010780, partial [Metschnikowia pulcherrima]